MADHSPITRLLKDWSSGNQDALSQLTPLVYRELHALAGTYLRRGRRNVTLQPTVLINEVYLRLIDQSHPVQWEARSHFFGIAARLMRNILVEYTRARHAAKRGGEAEVVTLDETAVLSSAHDFPNILDVHEALNRLAEVDPRLATAVELRHFGGMTCSEISCASGLSVATVKRDLRVAEAWLRVHLRSEEKGCARGC